ncbi:hypothetical protein HDU96_002755, partial [Phlyctochytrium bullatum]
SSFEIHGETHTEAQTSSPSWNKRAQHQRVIEFVQSEEPQPDDGSPLRSNCTKAMAPKVRRSIAVPKGRFRISDLDESLEASSSNDLLEIDEDVSINWAQFMGFVNAISPPPLLDEELLIQQAEPIEYSPWSHPSYRAHPPYPGPLTAADLPSCLCPPSAQPSIANGLHLSSLSSFRWGDEYSIRTAAPADDRLAVFIGDIPLSALA